MNCRIWLCTLTATWIMIGGARGESPAVEFNRDIRPILSDNCFACHGPDQNQRKADLRLDQEESARGDRGGYYLLAPGKPAQSALFARITAKDSNRMPPVKFGKQLSAAQVELIRRWIEQGAEYQKHWSLLAARRPALPLAAFSAQVRNAIDSFIQVRLKERGLAPSAEADKRTLIRRLAFDLTGLPPTPEQVDVFLADSSATAYEQLVDRLLTSPHYGERMAQFWLDLVRYADTGGYHSDNHRDIAPYRDYVIDAFNRNKRFNQFTIEQLAGDLLPEPTRETRIASGYNRLLMTTEEGGAQAKEYMAKYSADRVRNLSAVWLGTTLGCTECHDHKFDPFKTREFYQLAAFFADVKEKPVGRQDQDRMPTPEQAERLRQLDAQIAPLQKQLEAGQAKWEEAYRQDPKAIQPSPPKNIGDILALEPGKRAAAQKQALTDYFRASVDPVGKQWSDLQRLKAELEKSIASTLITVAVAPRAMRVLPRGNWLDETGAIVEPGTPAALPPLGVQDRRATRLDLAQWLTARENPLVARVFVNRLWKLCFGQGLVKSLEDFGSQGTWPTHSELLDWLALEFIDSGWDVKHVLKLMVMSGTYRQSSASNEQVRQRDPYNEWLAHQGRWRLDAEMVRDNALAVSGLLSRRIGGPSVKPYQPPGYWAMLNFPKREWDNDRGEGVYRRGLYTYWCRTFPHPSLVAFDAPSREECTVERPRSNTPQQALVLLNDPIYVEAARAFAERIAREAGGEPAQRIQFAYRQALSRPARAEEVQVLTGLYQRHCEQYQADRTAADAVLKVGDRPAPKEIEAAVLAAWTSVARVILNLHETVTRN